MSFSEVKAFVFDVFGTCVDWRTSVSRELEQYISTPGTDYRALADNWRQGYYASIRKLAETNPNPFPDLDTVHREILDRILEEENIALDEEARVNLNQCWHRLSPWPDTNPGVDALNEFAITSTLSNGNVRLLLDLKKYGKIPFDTILSAELFEAYKPNPKAYLEAARVLKLEPHEVCLVAAHTYDLQGAKKCGFKGAYIRRAGEDPATDPPKEIADVAVDSIVQLAEWVRQNK
ncbi:haloacid dehalogenase, type II [Fennellomyces sp. T-0311]|nr:haloacid dehalogenase, type II [Fennellomyces sp. T-0311]